MFFQVSTETGKSFTLAKILQRKRRSTKNHGTPKNKIPWLTVKKRKTTEAFSYRLSVFQECIFGRAQISAESFTEKGFRNYTIISIM
jgi:hypothetical protein